MNLSAFVGVPRPLLLCIAFLLCAQDQSKIFRIQPVRPVAELRAEALKSQPPHENGDFLKSELVDLARLDRRIKLDIRYATTNDFLSTPVYTQARAFLQRPAAQALLRAHRELIKQGYGLLIFDGYRPWYVTKIFWDATPPDKHEFVANPAEGSRHNRGCAVDLTLYDLKTGREIEMTGVYDEMSADVNESSGFCTVYCGWHTHGTIAGSDIKYAFIGNPDRCPSACSAQTTSPNGNAGADGMASIIAHELEEAVTDPDLNAWYDNRGQENADKCAWTFGSTYTVNGAQANMSLGGLNFLIQRNWVNASGGFCALSY